MADVSRKAIGYINVHMRGGSRFVEMPAGKNVLRKSSSRPERDKGIANGQVSARENRCIRDIAGKKNKRYTPFVRST